MQASTLQKTYANLSLKSCLGNPCNTFAPKPTKQRRLRKKTKIFKQIIKDEGIALDDERYYKRNEVIAWTPMTTLKIITYAMKVLHTQQLLIIMLSHRQLKYYICNEGITYTIVNNQWLQIRLNVSQLG